jgi:hypothetical protein
VAVAGQKAPHAAVLGEQVSRKVDRRLAAHPGTQANRQQLGIRQRARPLRQQPLARTLVGLPVEDRHACLRETAGLRRIGTAAGLLYRTARRRGRAQMPFDQPAKPRC